MNRLRIWIVLLAVWLALSAVVGHTTMAADLRHRFHGLLLIVLFAALFSPVRSHLVNSLLLGGIVVAFVAAAVPFVGSNTHLMQPYLPTLAFSAIAVTALLAQRVNGSIRGFTDAFADMAFGAGAAPLPAFEDAQSIMYRDLQRARYFDRPLSVIMFQVDKAALQTDLPAAVLELQPALARRYLMAKVAQVLDDVLPRFDPVAMCDNRFVAVLPEIDATEATKLAQTVNAAIESRVNTCLQYGVASLSREAATFESLLEQAEQRLNHAAASSAVAPEPFRSNSPLAKNR